MRCIYCGIEYSLNDACLCLPHMEPIGSWSDQPKVQGPWGEAEREWSLPCGGGQRFLETARWPEPLRIWA